MDQQPDIVRFQGMFAGPFPFTSDGVIVGLPPASFEEEMQTKITFAGGRLSSLQTLSHENFHQWFGDNVSEANFNLTFWKEGWATIGEYLFAARNAATAAGGLGTLAGDAAFDTSLANRFNTNYGTTSNSFWTTAPSNPTPSSLFNTSNTYTRPGTAYLALRAILDGSVSRLATDRWVGAMKQIQTQYGGGNITEPQLEDVFHQWLPNQSSACQSKLDTFFTQWFDTAYPTPNNATNKPQITGPGLNGPDHFYDDSSACTRATQDISFDSIPTKSPDDPDFDVSATTDSGLPLVLSADGRCTISGTTVHILGVGTCTIIASQAGDDVWKPGSISQAFAIVWPFSGFDPPLANPPAVNGQNVGSTVPVKFSLGGDRGLAILAAGSPVSVPVDCSTGTPLGPPVPTSSPGHSVLTYLDGEYTYLWKTDKAWSGSCRELRVILADGTTHAAELDFG
jgi:hypothetical protein